MLTVDGWGGLPPIHWGSQSIQSLSQKFPTLKICVAVRPGSTLMPPAAACGYGSGGEGGGGEYGGIEGVPVLVSTPRATPSSELNFEGRRAEQHERAHLPPHADPLTATGLGGAYGPSRLGESFFPECYCMVVVHYAYVVYRALCKLVHDTSGTHPEALCFTTQDEQ